MEMEVVDLSTPAPGSTADLRDRLQRAVARMSEVRDRQRQPSRDRDRLTAKIDGVKLALSYVRDGERISIVADDRPRLAVTPGLVQEFDNAYRAMLHEDTKPIRQRDVRMAVRVYAQTDLLAGMLRDSGVQGIPVDEPGVILSALRDLLGMRDGQPFAAEEELVHAAEAADTMALCGSQITEDTLVAIQDWRGHVTCEPCRIEAELLTRSASRRRAIQED